MLLDFNTYAILSSAISSYTCKHTKMTYMVSKLLLFLLLKLDFFKFSNGLFKLYHLVVSLAGFALLIHKFTFKTFILITLYSQVFNQ